MSEIQQVEYHGITFRFPEAALRGTDESPIFVTVSRPDRPDIVYPVWNQRRLGSEYLARHGCSFCALTTMLCGVRSVDEADAGSGDPAGRKPEAGAGSPEGSGPNGGSDADSGSNGPASLNPKTGPEAGAERFVPAMDPLDLRKKANALLGVRLDENKVRYSRLQQSLQRRKLSDLLDISERMPLNIAGASRILECYTEFDSVDGGPRSELRKFLLAKSGQALPVLATARTIPSLSGTPLCPGTPHSFLIIGRIGKTTMIVLDSSGSNRERIKYVQLDDLVKGIFRSGMARSLARREYYYISGAGNGGVIAPASL